MTAALAEAAGMVIKTGSVEVDWVTADGDRRQLALDAAAVVGFEDGVPVRRFTPRKGQRHLGGRWWCATTGGHVGFESWLERDHVMLLDFDPAVVGIAAQPFWLSWPNEAGTRTRHAPDLFARRIDGTALVVDCRPVERRRPQDLAKFAVTGHACARLRWEYRLVAGLDPVLVGNLRWLSGYRHPRNDVPAVGVSLMDVFATPTPLLAGAEAVGDPIAVLPALFHLLWRQVLSADLSRPLGEATLVAFGVAP
ncbi:TnsA-like heteromeric transposase endonuclease subunit [Mycobacterium haemophilum]|nr:TnsA-like heteromeric transposase endonuclease subunit [Mycobacterium haemophilum]